MSRWSVSFSCLSVPRAFVALPAALALVACSPPRAEGGAPGFEGSSSPQAPRGESELEGVAAYARLENAADTEVAGDLTLRIPRDWIAQQNVEPGHAHFVSRDNKVFLAVSDNQDKQLDDHAIRQWLRRPWTKVKPPDFPPARSIRFGRSGLEAESAEAKSTREGVPAKVTYARLRRHGPNGVANVLVLLVVADDAPADEKALALASVRSLGTR
jgi:hypothetical protein